TTQTSTESPSQFCLSSGKSRPFARPKLGSSSDLKVIAIAAEESSSGRKYRIASTLRYRCGPARKAPSRMLIGVCSSHVATIMSRTSPRPFQVLDLPSASIQLVSPVNSMAPIPFQVVKESATRSEEHTSELQSRENLVCRLLLEKKK